jgi:hypothetical protein
MKQQFTLILAILLSLPVFAQQSGQTDGGTLEISVDRREIHVGESFRLQIPGNGGSNQRPDTTALESQFHVLGTGFQSQVSIINGRRSDESKWLITLQAREAGEFEIPSMLVGKQRTKPFSIQILPAVSFDATTGEGGLPVFVELSIEDTQPYVQGKLVVTAQVWMDDTIQGGSLTDPSLKGALLERLGEDNSFTATRDGKSYQVIERQYALFPQESGPVTIPPVVFDGTQRRQQPRSSRGGRVDPFFSDPFFGGSGFGGLMQRGTPVRAQSQSLELNVLAKPEEAGGDWWLPAQSVEFVEQWEPQEPTFRVGEPVTRHLIIRAVGLGDSQMPALKMERLEGCKIYPGTAQSRTVTEGEEVVSLTVQPIVLVPTKAGPLTLPALEIPWWDTVHDVARTAKLEAQTVEVIEGDPATAALSSVAEEPQDGDQSNHVEPPPQTPTPEQESPALQYFLPVGLLLSLLITTGVWWRFQKRKPVLTAESVLRVKDTEAKLKAACDANQPMQAHAAVLDLGKALCPTLPMRNTHDVARFFEDGEFLAAIDGLQAYCFGKESLQKPNWDGQSLWLAYSNATRKAAVSVRIKQPLPPLYPQHS